MTKWQDYHIYDEQVQRYDEQVQKYTAIIANWPVVTSPPDAVLFNQQDLHLKKQILENQTYHRDLYASQRKRVYDTLSEKQQLRLLKQQLEKR